jgi:hypothetical protein
MKTTAIAASIYALLALSTATLVAKGGTIGIYAIIDDVSLEPNDNAPQSVRIRGVFVVPVPETSGQYKAPQRGYLYFGQIPGMESVVRTEWAELKALAGTGQGVGFAQYWVPNPNDRFGNPHHALRVKVRDDSDLDEPDVYPVRHSRGIVKTGDKDDPDFAKIVDLLRSFAHRH